MYKVRIWGWQALLSKYSGMAAELALKLKTDCISYTYLFNQNLYEMTINLEYNELYLKIDNEIVYTLEFGDELDILYIPCYSIFFGDD